MSSHRYVSPEEEEVLRTAVQEYRAGHRADRASAKDPAEEDEAEYQRALVAHYQAVRALIRAQNPAPTPTPEQEPDVRP